MIWSGFSWFSTVPYWRWGPHNRHRNNIIGLCRGKYVKRGCWRGKKVKVGTWFQKRLWSWLGGGTQKATEEDDKKPAIQRGPPDAYPRWLYFLGHCPPGPRPLPASFRAAAVLTLYLPVTRATQTDAPAYVTARATWRWFETAGHADSGVP